jgi:hypothetical protein
VRSARLYATALCVYEAYVNGERAGTAELSPGSTSYDRTLYAQAWDVTAAVNEGGSAASAEGGSPNSGRLRALPYGELYVLAQRGVQVVHERQRRRAQRHAQRCERAQPPQPDAPLRVG